MKLSDFFLLYYIHLTMDFFSQSCDVNSFSKTKVNLLSSGIGIYLSEQIVSMKMVL